MSVKSDSNKLLSFGVRIIAFSIFPLIWFLSQAILFREITNRIPRALIKSKIKPKASLIALGGGHYATGTDNLKRMLENLPKKLYYSDYQPSSWDWHDHIIRKL